jgi:hypothetical protein
VRTAGAKEVKGGGGEADSGHEGATFAGFREKVFRLWCRTLPRRRQEPSALAAHGGICAGGAG